MLVRKVRSAFLKSYPIQHADDHILGRPAASADGAAGRRNQSLCCAAFGWLKSARLLSLSSDWEFSAQWLIAATMMTDAAIRAKVRPQSPAEAILRREPLC